MVWGIENFSQRLEDAKSGKKSSVFSQSFYTHRFGYKMQMSICPYGDGKCRLFWQ